MQAGKLRHRVDIQKPTNAQNSLGETVPTFVDQDRVWAEVMPLSGRELLAARQTTGEVTHQVTIRWRDGLTPTHRIRFGTRIFEILSVINVEERNREMRVLCKEHVNG